MFNKFDQGEKQYPRVNSRLRAAVLFLMAVTVYALLLVAGTAHMTAAERETELLPQMRLGAPVTHLTVRMGDRVCDFEGVFVGDGMVRTGSRCVPQRRVMIHDDKDD